MIDPELATQAIRLALAHGASDAECTISEGEEFTASVRMRSLETLKDAGSRGAGLRVLIGKQVGSSYTSDLSAEGMRKLFRQFSFPGGVPSHVAPETPGSIHEGGELGYSLVHAYGAAFDNPDLLVCAVVGDGEAETGPLAGSWHSNKFVNPVRDGTVLPILHLNGYKIANPTVLSRIPQAELEQLMRGYGYEPFTVVSEEGADPLEAHQAMAATLDRMLDRIADIRTRAANGTDRGERPAWPMLILRTPKGWTGPKTVDGKRAEDSWRSHQVPMADVHTNPAHLLVLEEWMRSYRPEELFDPAGALMPELAGSNSSSGR